MLKGKLPPMSKQCHEARNKPGWTQWPWDANAYSLLPLNKHLIPGKES